MKDRVVGIGEVLWDMLPDGKRLGGAPGNFACHAMALGAEASIVTAVGEDALGDEILGALQQRGFQVDTVSRDAEHATGTVSIEMAGDGQPNYIIHEDMAWDHLRPTAAALEVVSKTDAICFGTLAQRHEVSRAAIQSLLASAPASALKVFDVNLRQSYYDSSVLRASLDLATVVKLNEDELPVICDLLGTAGPDAQTRLRAVVDAFELEAAALTCGEGGSHLYANGEWSFAKSRPVEVRDTIGAGDSFLAAFVMGLLAKLPLDQINEHANEIARFVCTCEGATPPIPVNLCQYFQPAA